MSRPDLSRALLSLGLAPRPAIASYARDQQVLAWSDQGVVLAGFARSRGLKLEDWLADAQVKAGGSLSPAELLRLLKPLLALSADAPFVLGQLWWPGHFGLASQALQQAEHSLEAAERLARYAGRLCPLLCPRAMVQGGQMWLVFTEAIGLPAAQRAALIDLHLSAFASLCQWRSGDHLPWRFHFNRTAPRDLSQHLVLMGPALQFDCQVDALSLPLTTALRPWPRDSGRSAQLAVAALDEGADAQALRCGWLAGVSDRLLNQLSGDGASLEALARELAVSSATLKRQFSAHGSHYQAELDKLRSLLALALMRLQAWSPEAVGQALGFVDTSNFRKSFRRWTGLSPRAWIQA